MTCFAIQRAFRWSSAFGASLAETHVGPIGGEDDHFSFLGNLDLFPTLGLTCVHELFEPFTIFLDNVVDQ